MRYDHLMKTSDDKIHWANIVFGLLALFAVVLALLMTLDRNIRDDFSNI
jgi:hypothetical protein